MVVLLSKKQAYLTINGDLRPANKLNISGFFSGLECDTFETGIRWLPFITKGADGAEYLEYVFKQFDQIKPLIDRDMLIVPKFDKSCPKVNVDLYNQSIFMDVGGIISDYVGKDIVATLNGNILFKIYDGLDYDSYTYEEKQRIYKAYSILRLLCSTDKSFFALYAVYGHAGGREILRSIMDDSGINSVPDDLYKLVPDNRNIYGLKWERIVNYLITGRKEQGYTYDFGKFLNEWTDSLNMSYAIHVTNDEEGVAHHRVPKDEKYPADLASFHYRYSEIIRQHQQKNSTRLYTARKMTLKFYEYKTKDGVYIFILPSSDEDMINESIQQNNCLAGYTTAHATGKTTIVFMRYADSPDKSLVTIERQGDQVIQKYRACNQPVSAMENAAIEEWLRETCEAKLIEHRIQEEVEKGLRGAEEKRENAADFQTA